MQRKHNTQAGLLAFLLALFLVVGIVTPVVYAGEGQTEEGEGAATTVLTDRTEIPEEHIFLQWEVDSDLTYRLDEDNYVWTVYDANGNSLAGSGTPVSAGYELTGEGDWFGSAKVTLTIVNNLQEEAKLRLLFMDALAEAALEIAGTMEEENESVEYTPDGVLTIQPEATGIVSFTITADLLQTLHVTIDAEDDVVGWVQVQVLSPVTQEEDDTQQVSDDETEEPTEDTTEAATEETTEETTEAATEETTEETTEDTTEETTEETTEPITEETTGETTEETNSEVGLVG